MTYYKDVDIELTKAQDGDVLADTDLDAIINSLANITQTIKGGRVMLPEFAFNGNELLFEPLSEDVAMQLANIIWEAIEFWDNRIIVDNIHVHVNYEHSQYEVTIKFEVLNITKEPENLSIILRK